MAKLLLVDDETALRSLICERLIDRGFDCAEASSAEEGLAMVKGDPLIEIVITDLRMPGMDGAGLLQEIKEWDPTVDVVIMSSYGTMKVAIDAMKRGASDFIAKPFDFDELQKTIDQCIERRETKPFDLLRSS